MNLSRWNLKAIYSMYLGSQRQPAASYGRYALNPTCGRDSCQVLCPLYCLLVSTIHVSRTSLSSPAHDCGVVGRLAWLNDPLSDARIPKDHVFQSSTDSNQGSGDILSFTRRCFLSGRSSNGKHSPGVIRPSAVLQVDEEKPL